MRVIILFFQKGGYYHYVKSGFKGYKELNMICPKCSRSIGMEKKVAKRDDYYRIFKSKEEIKEIKNEKDRKNKLKEINYMTLCQYQKKYIMKDYEKKTEYLSILYFKNDIKIVRNLSQISYRILNYILYSQLFFSKLVTNKSKDFDKYLPKTKTWVE
jgi:hypothetical protein